MSQTPMSIICKMGAILSDDVLVDIMPVAWQLLLAADQELAASSGQYIEHLNIVPIINISVKFARQIIK